MGKNAESGKTSAYSKRDGNFHCLIACQITAMFLRERASNIDKTIKKTIFYTFFKVDFPCQSTFPSVFSKRYAEHTAWLEVLCYVDKSHTSAFFFIFFGPLTFS